MGEASPEKQGNKLAGSPGKTEERARTGAQPGDGRTRGTVRSGERPRGGKSGEEGRSGKAKARTSKAGLMLLR